MVPKTFIIIGRSGCGKGTQAKLLNEYLEQEYKDSQVFYIESGKQFRSLVVVNSYTSTLAREINDSGLLQPSFLSSWVWSNILIEEFTGTEHLILDGIPRKLNEAKILDGALRFYKREKPYFVFINVTEAWSRQRLEERGRSDDKKRASIDTKMKWYESDVLPAVDFFRKNESYNFLEIKGEQTIEKVHEDIIKSLKVLKV